MSKIVVISEDYSKSLDIQLLRFFVQQFNLLIDLKVTPSLNWSEDKKDLILFSEQESVQFISKFPLSSQITYTIKSFDGLLDLQNKYIPQLYIYEAFNQAILKSELFLNIRSDAVINGIGLNAKVAYYCLSQKGFSKIYIVCDQQSIKEDSGWHYLQKVCFNTQIIFCNLDDLMSQKVSASVFINTIDFNLAPIEITTLSYFSFLAQEALVVDFTIDLLAPVKLIQECKFMGLNHIEGQSILILKIQKILETLVSSKDLKFDDLEKIWIHFLESKK